MKEKLGVYMKKSLTDKKSINQLLLVTDILSILCIIAIFVNGEVLDGAIWLVALIFLFYYVVGITIYLCICDSTIRKWVEYIIDLITWL